MVSPHSLLEVPLRPKAEQLISVVVRGAALLFELRLLENLLQMAWRGRKTKCRGKRRQPVLFHTKPSCKEGKLKKQRSV